MCDPYTKKLAGRKKKKLADNKNWLWENPDIRFNTGFKETIIDMVKELKERMPKEGERRYDNNV